MKPLETPQLIELARSQDGVEAQAAVWSDLLRDGDAPAELRAAFEQWHDADPAHAQTFQSIDRTYRIARLAGASHAAQAMEAEILARVVKVRRRRRALAIAAGLFVAVAVGTIAAGSSLQGFELLQERIRYALAGERLYHTAIGERLVATLEDGSVLTLNTNSRVVVAYHERTRGVKLLNGQAMFQVAKDPAHPFIVTAGNRTVTALGTAFDVRLSDERLQVTLLEGHVAIEPVAPPPAARGRERTDLYPGEQLVLVEKRAPAAVAKAERTVVATADQTVVHHADLKRATSWRNGQIIFDDEPLAEAVAELNRYCRRPLVLADPRLQSMRVSGVFDTSNPSVFIDTLTLHFPIRVMPSKDDQVMLGYRG